MGFLTPKVPTPPPPPPPPPPPVVPEPKVQPNDPVEVAKRKAKDPKAVSRAKTVKTSARGVIEDAPLEYASLMGKAKKKEDS